MKKSRILTAATQILTRHLPNTNYNRYRLVQIHVKRRTSSSTKLAIFTILRVTFQVPSVGKKRSKSRIVVGKLNETDN